MHCFTTSISHGVENYFPRLWGEGISDAIFVYEFTGNTACFAICFQDFNMTMKKCSTELLSFTGVNISTIWPATATASHVTKVTGVPDEVMRKPTLFADACVHIANEQTDK